jgi:predicted amidohydrolase YtcJ
LIRPLFPPRLALAFSVALVVPLTQSAHAERVIYLNARIYTADLNHPWANTLVVEGDRIAAVGVTLDRPANNGDRVVDLAGRLMIPGIIDSHVHSLFGSMALHGLNLWSPTRYVTAEQTEAFKDALRDYATKHPAEPVLFVRTIFKAVPPGMPNHRLLDNVVRDRPVIVHNVNEHSFG